jgi:hypothetical protein
MGVCYLSKAKLLIALTQDLIERSNIIIKKPTESHHDT